MALKGSVLVGGMALVLSTASVFAAHSDLQLIEAVKRQDKAAVRSLLKQHLDVNAATGDGTTALAWAAHWNDLETLDLLISTGANVSAADDLGVTPLWHACTNANSAMVEKLVKAGASPKTAMQTGETALMTCTRSGALEGVRLLLARGADVNARETQRGQTALMWAASKKHPDVTRVLVGHGAEVNARSNQGFTPLLFAARVGDLESARMLIAAGADVNASESNGMSALLMAAASGQEDVAALLVENGADPNAADPNGITALHFALQKALSLFRVFRSYTPEAEAYAVRPNMEKLIKALLAHGANPNARLVDNVMNAGNLFGSVDNTLLPGVTPFLLAAGIGETGIMRMLLGSGADPQLTTNSGATALMLAASEGSSNSRGIFFRERNPEQDRKQLGAVKLALELGVDINATDKWGQTAMHFAAYQSMDPIIQFLAEKGARVDEKDQFGMTPLSIAEGIIPEGSYESEEEARKVPRHRNKTTAELLRKLGASETTEQAPANALAGR
jgi:uncharacterized protein